MSLRCAIDHLTVTAPTLASGAAYVMETLGVAMGPGGEHPKMGTHNLLLRLGDALFLEVIAVNPAAAAPSRPCWFELDRPSPARLATWVARTTGLHAAADTLPEYPGTIETLTRGGLQWQLTVPQDGSLPMGGVAPALIEWRTPAHPASSMPASGCTLHRLDLFHPERARVVALLDAPGMADRVYVSTTANAPALSAQIDTPGGRRTIGLVAAD